MAVFSVASPLAARTPDRQFYGVGQRRLTISQDRFSHDIRCDLHSRDGKMRYVEHAIGFRIGRHADVLRSWFKIDDSAPMRWRDQLQELAQLKVAIDGRDMDRPTGSIVWLPVDMLEDARAVAIQPRPGRSPVRFQLDGFWELYDAAIAQGCTPEARFVR